MGTTTFHTTSDPTVVQRKAATVTEVWCTCGGVLRVTDHRDVVVRGLTAALVERFQAAHSGRVLPVLLMKGVRSDADDLGGCGEGDE